MAEESAFLSDPRRGGMVWKEHEHDQELSSQTHEEVGKADWKPASGDTAVPGNSRTELEPAVCPHGCSKGQWPCQGFLRYLYLADSSTPALCSQSSITDS